MTGLASCLSFCEQSEATTGISWQLHRPWVDSRRGIAPAQKAFRVAPRLALGVPPLNGLHKHSLLLHESTGFTSRSCWGTPKALV